MLTTKIVRVPGAVAVVFARSGQKLEADQVVMAGPVTSLCQGGEYHDVDSEPGINEFKTKAMNFREAFPSDKAQAFVFEDCDGRGPAASVTETVATVNAALKASEAGLIAKMVRRFV